MALRTALVFAAATAGAALTVGKCQVDEDCRLAGDTGARCHTVANDATSTYCICSGATAVPTTLPPSTAEESAGVVKRVAGAEEDAPQDEAPSATPEDATPSPTQVNGVCIGASGIVPVGFSFVFNAECGAVTAAVRAELTKVVLSVFQVTQVVGGLRVSCGSVIATGLVRTNAARAETLTSQNELTQAINTAVNNNAVVRNALGTPTSSQTTTARVCELDNAVYTVLENVTPARCQALVCRSGYDLKETGSNPTLYRCHVQTRNFESDDDLTDAEKAGIGLGVAFFVILVVVIAFLCLRGKEDATEGAAKDTEPATGGV